MATDQEDGPTGLAIPARLSNAVPQGPQRTTTNLESASLRKQTKNMEAKQPQPYEAARQAALARQQRQRASPPPQPQRQQQPPRRHSPPPSEPQPQYEHQPQPQPQPRPDGHSLAVPQPGGGLRRMAPPQHVTNMPYGQQWYPVNQALSGPHMAPSNDFVSHGGPIYVPYPPTGHVGGHSSYGEGHYGPPTSRYTAVQQLPVGGYRNGDM
jgi:hypothetical protein